MTEASGAAASSPASLAASCSGLERRTTRCPQAALPCCVTPDGGIDVWSADLSKGPAIPFGVATRILEAFAAGRGPGVLQPGAGEPDTVLAPRLAFWCDFGRAFVARVCGAIDPSEPEDLKIPPPEPADIAGLLDAVPPMEGGEYVTVALLAEVWADLGAAITAEALRLLAGAWQGGGAGTDAAACPKKNKPARGSCQRPSR